MTLTKELLLQKEKRMLQLEKVARIGSWTLNLNNKTIIASSVAEEIYGVEFTKLPLAVVQKITLLQYRPALDKALSDLVTKNAKYDIEFKICRPSDNKIIDIHSVATYDERSNTVFGIIQDITEHKLLEADLISQRKLYEEILEQSLAGYWDWDIPTGNEYLSPTFKKMFGYEVNEIENRADSWQKLIFAEDLPCVYDKFNLHVESKGKTPFYNEVRYHHKNGSTVWVICTGKVIEWDDAGKAKRMIGCHIDITERKKLEESLRESKQKAELLLNVAAEIIISLDSQGDITLLNESGHRILGYKSPELVGKNWFDTCLPIEDKEEIRKYFGLLLEGKSTLLVTHESDVVTLDGVRKTILWHNFLLKDKDGKAIGLFSSGEDITESKKAAEVLKERTEQLKKVQEITHVGSWYLNTETNDVTWTEELYKMYGFDPTKPVPPYTEHMKLFTAESWDVLSVSLAKTAKTGIPYELELVTVRKDGSNGWMWVRGEAVKDEKKIIGLWGAAQDITERKKTEEKIQILLSEKNTILKEVHHRIKNNMNTVSSLLTLQANATKDQTLIAALDDAKSRINSMSLLYDKLYRSSDYTEMSVKVYLSSLVDEVVANFPNSKMVKVEKNLQDFDLDVKRLQPLGIMINELITNTMKYAFVVKECGHIAVSAIRNDNRIIVSVQDDGIGIPESVSFENSTGFGLQLVYTLAQQLDGSIRIERGNGARVVIEFND